MLNVFQQRANRVGDTVFAASRQVWLAGLGAAVVSREWAEKEAAGVFRTLVKEGTAVESRAIRIVGDQVGSSVTKANVVLKHTRTAIGNVVRAYTDTAADIVSSLPRFLPQSALSAKAPTKRRAKVAHKSATKATRTTGKRAKRAAKATSKR